MVAKVISQVVVYRAVNLINGKHYIGVTKRGLGRREHEHRYDAQKGSDFLLHKAIRKYGGAAFVFKTIFDFDGDYEMAMMYEAEVVEKEQPAYNLVPGGRNRIGPLSETTVAKMRASHVGKATSRKGVKMPESYVSPRIGKKHSEAARAKMSATWKALYAAGMQHAMKGREHTPETKVKMSAAKVGKSGPWAGKKRPEASKWLREANRGRQPWNAGVPMTASAKEKVSAAKKGCAPPPVTPLMRDTRVANMRKAAENRRVKIVCLDDGKTYTGLQAVVDAYGLSESTVVRRLRDGRPSRSGLRFTYEVPSS